MDAAQGHQSAAGDQRRVPKAKQTPSLLLPAVLRLIADKLRPNERKLLLRPLCKEARDLVPVATSVGLSQPAGPADPLLGAGPGPRAPLPSPPPLVQQLLPPRPMPPGPRLVPLSRPASRAGGGVPMQVAYKVPQLEDDTEAGEAGRAARGAGQFQQRRFGRVRG